MTEGEVAVNEDVGDEELDGNDLEDEEFDEESLAERVLDVCARAIVDDPDAVEVDVEEDRKRMILHLRVAPEDMGKVIGRHGRVANALRTLVKAAGSRDGIQATVEIED